MIEGRRSCQDVHWETYLRSGGIPVTNLKGWGKDNEPPHSLMLSSLTFLFAKATFGHAIKIPESLRRRRHDQWSKPMPRTPVPTYRCLSTPFPKQYIYHGGQIFSAASCRRSPSSIDATRRKRFVHQKCFIYQPANKTSFVQIYKSAENHASRCTRSLHS